MPEKTDNHPFSQHIFLLPFTFASPKREMSTAALCAEAANHIASSLFPIWKESLFRPQDGGAAYGEFQYFHPHVREQYFSLAPGQGAVRFFKLALPSQGQARYRLYRGNSKEPFELLIKGVSLRLCDTGVGLLSIELHNHSHASLDEVLLINDLGRRVFPPFMSPTADDAAIIADNVPSKVEIDLGYLCAVGEFDDLHFKRPVQAVASHLTQLMASAGFGLQGEEEASGLPYSFRPTADDRMFVVCWYGSDELSQRLTAKHSDAHYSYEKDADWYRFTFVDGGSPLCRHDGMLRELIAQTTYQRWTEEGTLFGLSRYSLVCLTDRQWYGLNVIRHHMRGIYAQMAAMLLIQRASLLRFSQKVGRVSALALAGERGVIASPTEVGIHAEKLQADFLKFFNGLWAREVSPQEQGLEMYSQAFELVGLGQAMEELRAEIHDLYDYLRLLQERDENRGVRGLTKLGAMFLPMSLLAALFSMNLDFFERFMPFVPKESWFSPGFKLLAFACLAWLAYSLVRRWLEGHGAEMSFAAEELRLSRLMERFKRGK